MSSNLYVGAGKAYIPYTEDMLPTFGENYNAIHDLPMLQVLLLQSAENFAIISVDVVILDIKQKMAQMASSMLGISEDHILIHATHVLATPHFKEWDSTEAWMQEHGGVTKEQAEIFVNRENKIVGAHMEALQKACHMAEKSLKPAKLGFGTAQAKIAVNRVIETSSGWWQGVNQEGPTDPTVFVVRIDDMEGNLMAVLYNCNVAPGCMEFSTVNGGRMISGDLASASENYIDSYYGNDVVSIYTTGFTGDQWQALRARLDYLDNQGNQVIRDLHEAGFYLVDILATRLGEQVIKAVNQIKTAELSKPIAMDRYEFMYPGQSVSASSNDGPVRECQYIPCGSQSAEIKVLQIEDTAVIACGVELCYETAKRIKENSPYHNTIFMEFTTKGFGYLPEAVFYDRMSFQSRKSRFAKGSAEKFGDDVLRSLHTSYRKD